MLQPVPDALCPECGTPRATVTLPPPWPVRRRRILQLAALLLAIGGAVWLNYAHAPVMTPVAPWGPGVGSVDLPLERITRADLGRYASGELRDGRLMRAVRGELITDTEITAALTAPTGQVQEFRRIGWPTNWLVYRWDAQYDNVYARTGASAKITMPRDGWYGWWSHVRQRIDERGRRESRIFIPLGLSGSALVLIGAWAAARAVRATLRKITAWAGWHSPGRSLRFLPWGCVALALVAVLYLSLNSPARTTWIMPVPWMPPTVRTGVTLDDFAGLGARTDGESAFARAILKAVGTLAPSDGAVLAIGHHVPIVFEASYAHGGWPPGLLHFSRSGTAGRDARLWRLHRARIEDDGLTVQWRAADDGFASRGFTITLTRAAVIVFDLWLVWAVTGLLLGGVGWHHRRRARRRVARSRCVRCGYSLAGLAATVSSPA